MTLTNDPKTNRKNRRRRAIKNQRKISFLSLLRWSFVPFLALGRALLKVRAYPRAAAYVFSPILFVVIVLIVKTALQRYHENVLPRSVVVNVANGGLRQKIRQIAEQEMSEAQRLHKKRTAFLLGLSKEIENIDAIDEFWIRLGFDKKLQVTATEQIPVLLLEAGSGERYLVGHKLRIIAKNPSEAAIGKILRISVPELKIHGNTIVYKTSASNKFARTLSSTRLVAENMNLPWLFRQTQLLQKHLEETDLHYGIEQVVWKNRTGFSLIIKGLESGAHVSHETLNRINVTLGDLNLDKKVEKLAEVLSDLRSRKMVPESIDLNFTDKAIIKMSEQSVAKPL